MNKRRVVEMVEMFESPYSITIYASDSSCNEDEVDDQTVSSPAPLLTPSTQNFEAGTKSPSSPTYNSVKHKRKHTMSVTQVPISEMTVDVDETRLDKIFKILAIAKEFIFFPFLYTTRGIEVSY